jgi:hypothetical protein
LLVRPLNERSFEIVFGARRYRAAQMAEAETVPVRIKQMSDAEVLEAQLVKLSIVGKSFLCLYATLARRLYVIDVPGLPQIAGYNGLSPPRAMACGPDSRFSTLVIRHRIQSNSPRETLLTVVISGLATIRPEFENRPLSGSMSALLNSPIEIETTGQR